MFHKRLRQILVLFCLLSLFLLLSDPMISSYGGAKTDTGISPDKATIQTKKYKEWLPLWKQEEADTGKILLTPGGTERDLNFSWYSKKKGTPAVMISADHLYIQAKIFRGTAHSISRSNGSITYHSANHVSVTGFLAENTQYYYRYTDNINSEDVKWSSTYEYHSRSFSSLAAILVGDAQIGASGTIPADTYNWSRTVEKALATEPKAAFFLSAGDQINYKTNTKDKGLREREYAGFLFPGLLRNIPIAAAIGNHESKGKDYQYHFHNPNNNDGYGSTPSGCDYYFSYGDVLFLVLNSNNRNSKEHRKLIKQAISEFPKAKWRIALFHHDIYGSGAAHSNRTSANMRIFFAPLMDEYKIDLAINGHDHSYARSFSMLDGTAIQNKSSALLNPAGTTYITLGSSSGSKRYELAKKKQFYVAERSNQPVPTFSTLNITGNTLTLRTYDYNGKKYADDFQIIKTAAKENPIRTIKKAENKKAASYTKASFQKLKRRLKKIRALLKPISKDPGAQKAAKRFRKANDPLSYYGYAAGTTKALPKGFSTLLDKTRLRKVTVSASRLRTAYDNLRSAMSALKKTSLTVRAGKKKCKNKTRLRLKKGKKLKLKISRTPAKAAFTCRSASPRFASISKKGVIRAKKRRKNAVPVKIKFQNRVLALYIQVK